MKRRTHRIKKARRQLNVATKQMDKASIASWEPAEPAECVSFAFYAYENAVVAAADALGIRWTKNHYEKAELATKLAKDGKLKTDAGPELTKLNTLRKDVSYGDPGYELSQVDLEDVVADLEGFLREVEDLVFSIEENRHGR